MSDLGFKIYLNNLNKQSLNRKKLQQRTKTFHVDVIKLCSDFTGNAAGFEIAKQLVRSAGSVGANYRASEVIKEAEIKSGSEVDRSIDEANQLSAIFAATDKTAKANKNSK